MTSFTSRYGDPAADYAGAHIWAHSRHTATVVSIAGRVDATNVEDLIAHITRLSAPGTPLVLDLSGVTAFPRPAVRLLETLTDRFSHAGVQWALVPGAAVARRLATLSGEVLLPIVASAVEAEHDFDDAVLRRRRLLLPLLRKSA